MTEVRKITFLEKRKNKAVYQTVHTVKNVPRERVFLWNTLSKISIP